MASEISGTFTITISGQAGAYLITAEGPGNIQVKHQPFTWLPTVSQKLTLAALENGELVSPDHILDIGQMLYRSVFIPIIATTFKHVQAISSLKGGIRLRLQINVPEFLSLPWEAMHDGQRLLSSQSDSPMVRSLFEGKNLFNRLSVRGPLRVLFVGASPEYINDEPAVGLEIHKDIEQLRQLLGAASKKKQIIFDTLLDAEANLDNLRSQLLKNYHILCFAGHGDSQNIYLDDGDGIGQKISARMLAQELEGKQIRLVFLAACSTSSSSRQTSEALAGYAQNLAHQASLPAIIAMQYPISDDQATQLTVRFFETLATFQPVDVALAEARKSLIHQGNISRDVIAPVIYLQTLDSSLFQKARNWIPLLIILSILLMIVLVTITPMLFRARQERGEAQATAVYEATRRTVAEADREIESTRSAINEQRALTEQHAKEEQNRIALSRKLAALSQEMLEQRLDVSLLLSVEAYQIYDTFESKSSLFSALQHSPYLVSFLRNRNSLQEQTDKGSYANIAFSPDGEILASGEHNGTITLWNVANHRMIEKLPADRGNILHNLAFSPDGKILASFSSNGSTLWDVTTLQARGTSFKGNTLPVNCIDFSSDGKFIVSGGGELNSPNQPGEIIFWNVANYEMIGLPIPTERPVTSITFSPDGKILASSIEDRLEITIWDTDTYEILGRPFSHSNSAAAPISLAFSPDGRILASGTNSPGPASQGAEIITWDIATQQQLGHPMTSTTRQINSLAFSPDGQRLISNGGLGTGGSFTKDIMLWFIWPAYNAELANQNEYHGRHLKGHSDEVTGVAFHPKGNIFASIDVNGSIILWDSSDETGLGKYSLGRQLKLDDVLYGIDDSSVDRIEKVSFSEDDKLLIAENYIDGNIIAWNIETGQKVSPDNLPPPESQKTEVVTPDNKLKIVAGEEITIEDVDSGQVLGVIKTGAGYLTVSHDGKFLVTYSYPSHAWMSHPAFLWDIEVKSWINRACKLVNRNLTEIEWKQYIPDQPYRKTCTDIGSDREPLSHK